MALTAIAVEQAQPKDKPFKLYDGGGLYLLVNPDGSRYWRMNYRLAGKQSTLALGVYRGKGGGKVELTLAQARKKRDEHRRLLDDKLDPRDELAIERESKRRAADDARKAGVERRLAARHAREAQQQAQTVAKRTVATIAEEWFKARNEARGGSASLWSAEHAAHTWQSLDDHVLAHIGQKPITDVDEKTLLGVLGKLLAAGKAETASRVYQRLGAVWRYAQVHRYVDRDPVHAMRDEFKVQKKSTAVHPESFAAVPRADLPGLLRAIDGYGGRPTTRLGLQLLALVFTRPGELRAATWPEFDLDSDTPTWVIPADRMKIKRRGNRAADPHIVPLARQAVGIIRELRAYAGTSAFVLPHERTETRCLSENTFNAALNVIGYRGRQTAHGFRSIAATALREELGFRHETVERQLAHEQQDKSAAPYDRAKYLEDRRRMMQAWADYLDLVRKEGTDSNVVPMSRAAR